MRPVRFALALGALATLLALPGTALARERYQVHFQIESDRADKTVSLSLPWTPKRGGSPFDFSESRDSEMSIERLRWIWTTLDDRAPGERVTITRKGKSTHASRQNGYLVLEPEGSRDDDHARVRIPGEIVEALLRTDGRLRDEDVTRLLTRRDRVYLVRVESDDAEVDIWIARDDERASRIGD